MSGKIRVRDFIPGFGRHLFDNELRPRLSLALSLAAVCIGWMSVIIAASESDHTLRLPYPGRGLLNHYGFQATVLVAYLVILTAYCAVSRFLRTFDNIEGLLRP